MMTTMTMMMMMIMMIMIIMIITIIALKGTIPDFYNLLRTPRPVSNMYTQVARAQLSANHLQHIELLSLTSGIHILTSSQSLLQLTLIMSWSWQGSHYRTNR